MMHSIKGGWVGQTFALAKRNESEGRKSRIRRSKEERKTMVESFIKKYQESNNGNFPSLNLTHKEVGGSFYTVREIVRDIIQENRVLGPAKFNLEELTSDQFFEQNPLGSIARDPQAYVAASSIENHLESNKSQDTTEETLPVSDGNYTGAEHQMVDKGHIINGSQVDVINKESFEATSPELQVSEPLAPKQNVEQELATTTTPTVIVDLINKESFETTSPELELSVHLTPKQNVEQELAATSMPTVKVDVINKESFETTSPELQVSEHLTPKQNVEQELAATSTPTVKADVINKESFETTSPELPVSEPLALKQNVKQELATTTTPIVKVSPLTEDLIVETFPLRPVARAAHRIEEGFVESRGSNKSPEKDIKMLELEQPKERSKLNGKEPTKNSNSSDGKLVDDLGNPISKNNSNGGHDKEKILEDTLPASTNHSTRQEHFGHGFEDCTDFQVGVPHQNTITFETINQSQLIDEAKTSIQDGFQTNNLTKTEGSKTSEEGLENANKHRVDDEHGGNTKRRSNPTLDRINLDSWEGTPEKSVKQGPNPLMAIFKALVEAFVKFWSE